MPVITTIAGTYMFTTYMWHARSEHVGVGTLHINDLTTSVDSITHSCFNHASTVTLVSVTLVWVESIPTQRDTKSRSQ